MAQRRFLRSPARAPRRATAAPALCIAALGLTACDPGIIGSGEVRELTVLSEQGAVGMEAIAGPYTEGRHSHVLLETMVRDHLYERLAGELTSGTVSFDVVALDAGWLSEFADELEPLDHVFASDERDDIFPGVLQGAEVEGRYVGVPVWVDSDVLYYRTDLFEDAAEQVAFEEEYGYPLAPPADWEQYRDVAEFFTRDTDGDGDLDLYGTDLKGAVPDDWLATVSQAGAEAVVLDGEEVTVHDAEHVRALDFYRSLVPFAPRGAARLDRAGARILFLQGSLAMMRFPASAYPQIPGNSPVSGDVGVAPMVAGPGGVAGIPRALYLAVPNGAPNRDTAMDFISFAFEHNELLIETPPRLPARVSVFQDHADREGFEHYGALLETLSSPATRPLPAHPRWQEIVETVLTPTLQRAVEGDGESQALLDEAKAQIDALLRQP